MILSFINIRKVPREVLKTEGEARGFQHFPRDLANVNEWKIMFDPSIDSLIGARCRKPVTSHGILVTLNVIGHVIVKNYTTLISHYVYMGDVTGMV